MFDFVVVAMVAIVPVLAWSVAVVRHKHLYGLHKRMQLALGIVLLIAVVLFEVDIRLDASWWERALQSPYHERGILRPFLFYIHLPIAVATTILWSATILGALRKFPKPAAPGAYSHKHKWLGWLSTFAMFATALTGWAFYWMAFVAT